MLDGTGSESRERRNYVLEVVDATILAGGDVKPGDKASLNLMNKKSDDFENYESKTMFAHFFLYHSLISYKYGHVSLFSSCREL